MQISKQKLKKLCKETVKSFEKFFNEQLTIVDDKTVINSFKQEML